MPLKTRFWELPIVLRSGGGWVGHGLDVGEVGPADVGEMEDGMSFDQNTIFRNKSTRRTPRNNEHATTYQLTSTYTNDVQHPTPDFVMNQHHITEEPFRKIF